MLSKLFASTCATKTRHPLLVPKRAIMFSLIAPKLQSNSYTDYEIQHVRKTKLYQKKQLSQKQYIGKRTLPRRHLGTKQIRRSITPKIICTATRSKQAVFFAPTCAIKMNQKPLVSLAKKRENLSSDPPRTTVDSSAELTPASKDSPLHRLL